ncbi:MAG: hypothetical protein CMJ49_08335 [Planctomycetaceae bacterium]|nr:hypothetical protein [Planctomycetaceae bacterium]
MQFERFMIVTLIGLMLIGVAPPAMAQDAPVRLIAEAEDFTVVQGDWRVGPFRENYYASTFALTFLSRMGCLGAPAQMADDAVAIAEQVVTIPYDGSFEVLARYEHPYNFAVAFDVEIEQGGRVVHREAFGRPDDDKIWGCTGSTDPEGRRIPMPRFFWGATDNLVWQEGGRATLTAGAATIRLIARNQEEDATRTPVLGTAKRHVDLICLTDDEAGREAQRQNPAARTYVELDGWLTQAGDLYARVTNRGDEDVIPQFNPYSGGQHSPYSVHLRDWQPIRVMASGYIDDTAGYAHAGPRVDAVDAEHVAPRHAADHEPTAADQLQPGQTSGWVPVGQLMDGLHNYGWMFDPPCPVDLEFAIPDGRGGLRSVKKMTVDGKTLFEIPGVMAPNDVLRARMGDLLGEPVIRTVPEALTWLTEQVGKFPKRGRVPDRFYIYNIGGFGNTPDYPEGRALIRALGDNTTLVRNAKRTLITHWGDPSPSAIDEQVSKHEGGWDDLYVVSYGDEIHLPPIRPGSDEFEQFFDYRHSGEWAGPVVYTTDPTNPLYYYSQLCAKEKGGAHYAKGTAYYADHGVLTGANYSPHSNYLVSELDYIRPFKIGAMSMPWSEDYIWQIPEFSVQVMGYLTSGFRAGAKYHDNPIHMYVMPHSPGNTPRDFRLSFYTAVAHGATMINYFCASPLASGATENYIATDDLAMWRAVYDCTHDAGVFEDYVMDGKVRPAQVGLLLSSVDDVMTGATNSNFAMHNNERKAIYYALRHSQVPVDFLSEDDVIDGLASDYKVIYVTQQWMHSDTVSALRQWVEAGGTLIAHVGGGFLNEFNQPNPEANELYGVKSQRMIQDPNLLKYLLEENKPFLSKQDLPGYEPFDQALCHWEVAGRRRSATVTKKLDERVPVIVWKQQLTVDDGRAIATFDDDSPAIVVKEHGEGRAMLVGFLPGQAYLKSGLPNRPVDRGSSDDAFTHFLPTEMNRDYRHLIVDQHLPTDLVRPVRCSNGLVEMTVIETTEPKRRLAVPLMNFTGEPIETLWVSIRDVGQAVRVRSVEQGELEFRIRGDRLTLRLPLSITDMILIDLD